MVGKLLIRGMLTGIVAGLLAFLLALSFGEPQVDKAIAFEAARDRQKAEERYKIDVQQAQAAHRPVPVQAPEEPEIVSRSVQGTVGLFTGVMTIGVAFGGIFALVFAFAYGRLGEMGPRATSAVLAAMAFVSYFFVPNLKYPANPPAIGEAETIAARTGLFFSMIVLSIIAMVLAVMLRSRLVSRLGPWNASIAAGCAYAALMAVVTLLLPTVMEVPDTFSAVVLWNFRMTTIGIHAVLWGVIGLLFGALAERALVQTPSRNVRRPRALGTSQNM